MAYTTAAMLLGVTAAPAGAMAGATTPVPVPVLGLSGPGLSLQSAARVSDGSILLGGRRGGRAFVARVRPNGRLEGRFGRLGFWESRPATHVVRVLASPDGKRAVVEVRRERGNGPSRVFLLTADGRARGELAGAGGGPFAAAIAFDGDQIAVARSPCTPCQIRRYDASSGRSAGPPVAVSPAPADQCAPQSIAALVSVVGGLLATTDDLGACTHAAVRIDGTGVATAADRAPGRWLLGAPLPGGNACALAKGLDAFGDGSFALGPITSPDLVMPTSGALPESLRRHGDWNAGGVFAIGAARCGALLQATEGKRAAMLLQSGNGTSVVALAPGAASVVAARCLEHVLVFGTEAAGNRRQVVVQAVALEEAQRAERHATPSVLPAGQATPCAVATSS